MKIVLYVVAWICATVIGSLLGIVVAKATVETKDDWKKIPFMYVFNEETQMWDRARVETLKNAKCENIREYYPFR